MVQTRGLVKAKLSLFIIVGSMLALACGFFWRGASGFTPNAPFASNGEQIYFTAINAKGEPIRYTGGARYGGMMMGGRLACVSCHGVDGRGGPHWMHMQPMDAPDIRYSALVKDEHEGGAMEYDLEMFRQAVVLGQHPDGEALSADMPRWSLSDEDLAALFEYLKTLP